MQLVSSRRQSDRCRRQLTGYVLHSIEMVEGVGNNKNLGVTDECLLLFGNGDGGGGPTPRMLGKVRVSPRTRSDEAVTDTRVAAGTLVCPRSRASRGPGRQDWQAERVFPVDIGQDGRWARSRDVAGRALL